eukprot:7391630-Prymnesium_polylepis.1
MQEFLHTPGWVGGVEGGAGGDGGGDDGGGSEGGAGDDGGAGGARGGAAGQHSSQPASVSCESDVHVIESPTTRTSCGPLIVELAVESLHAEAGHYDGHRGHTADYARLVVAVIALWVARAAHAVARDLAGAGGRELRLLQGAAVPSGGAKRKGI